MGLGLCLGLGCGNEGERSTPDVATAPEHEPPLLEPKGPPPLPRPTDPAAFVGQHVVVADGATLYLGPEADAATVTLRLPPAAGERAPTPVQAMTVLGHEGGRLKVKPAGAADRCTSDLPALASVDVALWVEPAALSRVLGRAIEASFPDGTSVKLRPGTPVGEPGERVEVSAHALRLAVPIDEGDVSTLYAAVEPIVIPSSAGDGADGARPTPLAPGAPLTYAGGDPVLPESALLGGGVVLGRRTDGNRTFVRVASQCAEVEALADPDRLVPVEPGAEEPAEGDPVVQVGRYAMKGPGGDPRLARIGAGPRWRVDAGKALTWPSGTAAGTTTASLELSEQPTAKGDRQCFAVPLSEAAQAEGEKLPLCVAAGDVTEIADPFTIAASAGLLGALSASGGGAFGPSPFGSAFDSGLGDEDIYGGLMGAEIGESFGAGGLGLSGSGRGGGGTGEGTIGLGTLGHGGGGGGGGSGYGSGSGLGSGSAKTTKAAVGTVTASGLDAKEAARVIARSRNQLRYCYEKQLLTDPALGGRLTLSLTIDAGAVSSASASGDMPEAMRLCVERSAKRWKVPGSGSLSVPVTFSAE